VVEIGVMNLYKELADIFAPTDWLSVGIDAALGLAFAMTLFRLLRMAFKGQWFSHSAVGLMLRRTEPSLQSLLPILSLVILLQAAPDSMAHIVFFRSVVTVLFISALTFAIARLIDTFGDWVIQRHPYNVADNLAARRVLTQTRVVVRTVNTVVVLIGLSIALITFPAVRKFGVSLLASAGVAGVVLGLAARTVLGNILAGLQIAITQPIRIDDVLIVEGEWGRVEEITGTYVVIRVWDERRLVVPLQWFIEHPFQNWTRTNSDLIGSVKLWLDYRTPLEPLRAELKRLVEQAPEWDRKVQVLQVTDASPQGMEVRALASSSDSGRNWDLCCKIREGLLQFVQKEYPDCLPRFRADIEHAPGGGDRGAPGRRPERAPAH
jgi:small-conductance mechanosensitive channel